MASTASSPPLTCPMCPYWVSSLDVDILQLHFDQEHDFESTVISKESLELEQLPPPLPQRPTPSVPPIGGSLNATLKEQPIRAGLSNQAASLPPRLTPPPTTPGTLTPSRHGKKTGRSAAAATAAFPLIFVDPTGVAGLTFLAAGTSAAIGGTYHLLRGTRKGIRKAQNAIQQRKALRGVLTVTASKEKGVKKSDKTLMEVELEGCIRKLASCITGLVVTGNLSIVMPHMLVGVALNSAEVAYEWRKLRKLKEQAGDQELLKMISTYDLYFQIMAGIFLRLVTTIIFLGHNFDTWVEGMSHLVDGSSHAVAVVTDHGSVPGVTPGTGGALDANAMEHIGDHLQYQAATEGAAMLADAAQAAAAGPGAPEIDLPEGSFGQEAIEEYGGWIDDGPLYATTELAQEPLRIVNEMLGYNPDWTPAWGDGTPLVDLLEMGATSAVTEFTLQRLVEEPVHAGMGAGSTAVRSVEKKRS